MGIIMIKCPVTGRDASTGIETIDIEELPAVTAKMVCPACGRVHDWIKRRFPESEHMRRHLGGRVQRGIRSRPKGSLKGVPSRRVNGLRGNRIDAMPPVGN